MQIGPPQHYLLSTMLVQRLRYLIALARERHFARAANVCCVKQPTLSAGIKHLEPPLDP